jgi:DNA-binding HxlR family transcriptional regulator
MPAMPATRRRTPEPADPPIDALAVLQGKWTLQIVQALLDGPRGFNELARAIGGCNPATLTQRLDALEQAGLLERTVHSTMPPRTSYCLTRPGRALDDVVIAIERWGRRHLSRAQRGARVRRPTGR